PVRLVRPSPIGDPAVEHDGHSIGRREHGAKRVVLGPHAPPHDEDEIGRLTAIPRGHPRPESLEYPAHRQGKSKAVARNSGTPIALTNLNSVNQLEDMSEARDDSVGQRLIFYFGTHAVLDSPVCAW